MVEDHDARTAREAHDVRLSRPPVEPARTTLQGWPYPFRPEPWDVVRQHQDELLGHLPEYAHMLAIVDSVLASSAADALGVFTSKHDLMVRPLPPADPPYDVVAVRAPGSLERVKAGSVVVEHLSTTGHDDRLERPAAEAVPLFWRFMIEKFGVSPL